MRELITEEQAGWIVMAICALITLASLAYGWYRNGRIPKNRRKLLWAQTLLFALAGGVVWLFWLVFNSIENSLGLDSLKALEINFFIAIGIGVVFTAIYYLIPRWIPEKPVSKRSK